MDRAGPQIRANYAKLVVGGIKRLPEPQSRAIFEIIGEPLRNEIREAGMLEWINARHFFAVTHAIERVLEPAESRAFWKDRLHKSLEGRLLGPLRVGAIALYGRRPGSLVKRAPLAWSLVAKHCGVCEVTEPSKNSVVLAFDQLPPVARETQAMVHILAGGCDATIEHLEMRGHVVTHGEHLGSGRVKIEVQWEA
jgi:hypothetical protein